MAVKIYGSNRIDLDGNNETFSIRATTDDELNFYKGANTKLMGIDASGIGFLQKETDPIATKNGQIYWNTTSGLKVWDGSYWIDISEPLDPTISNAAYVRLGFNNNGNNSGTSNMQTTVTPSGSYSYTTSSKTGTHALDFGETSTGYVDIQTQSTSTTFSMGGWFYITRANPSNRTYIVDFRTSDTGAGYWLFDNLDSMTVYRHNGEEVFSHTVPTNQWVHWVLTSNGSSNFKFYENGSLVRTGSTYSDNLSTTVTLGTYHGVRGGSGEHFMQGKVDNFFLALTEYNAYQISRIYNSQVSY